MTCPVSEGNLWLMHCRPSPATSLTFFASSGSRDVIESSAHPTQNVLLLASPCKLRWPARLTHFSSTILILFPQLSRDRARNPKPIDLKFCSPPPPVEEQVTEEAAKHSGFRSQMLPPPWGLSLVE